MTSELKCPFCGEELSPSCGYGIEVYMCPNLTCHEAPGYAEDGVWQALIHAKQDVKNLKEALCVVRNQYRLVKPRGFSPRGDMATLCAMGEVAEKALEQIEQKD